MKEVFDNLKKLQEVLAEKYALQNEIEEAPKRLTAQEELLARLKKEFIEKNTEYEQVKSKVGQLRTELSEVEAAREKSEKGMDDITTHREYEALDKEIKDATEKAHALRKDLEIEEKVLAELNDTLKTSQEMIQSQETDLTQSQASLNDEIAQKKSHLEELEQKENSCSEGIDPEIIFKFTRIVKSKNEGIVAVKGKVCDGCHMILPAQFANDVHAGDKIVFCPYCSRILFYEEIEGDEEQYYQIEDTENLIDTTDDDDWDEDFDDDDEDIDDRDVVKELE